MTRLDLIGGEPGERAVVDLGEIADDRDRQRHRDPRRRPSLGPPNGLLNTESAPSAAQSQPPSRHVAIHPRSAESPAALAAPNPIPLRLTMANDQERRTANPTDQPHNRPTHPPDRLPQHERESPQSGTSNRSFRQSTVNPSDDQAPVDLTGNAVPAKSVASSARSGHRIITGLWV